MKRLAPVAIPILAVVTCLVALTVLLGTFGVLSRATLFTGLAILGIVAARYRSLPAIALFAVTILIAAIVPHRGEWIPGGWDPGVNMNEGFMLSRTGTFRPPPSNADTILHRTGNTAFMREQYAFQELFPGIPVDPANGAIAPYFYRGTPAVIAVLDLIGGHTLALRSTLVLALLAAILFVALLSGRGLTPGRASVIAGVLAFLLQPIFLHHAHEAVSEMLELLLICGLGLLVSRDKPSRGECALATFVVALGMINRPSFILFASALIAFTSFRRNIPFHASLCAGLLAGLAWYTWVTPESVVKIAHLWPQLVLIGATTIFAGTLIVLWRGTLPACNAMRSIAGRRVPASVLFLLALATLIAWESQRHNPFLELTRNILAWMFYSGPPLLALALCGFVIGRKKLTSIAPWCAALALTLAFTLFHKHTAELYPWATKRWLIGVPMIGIGIAALFQSLEKWRWPVALLYAIALIQVAPLARDAWMNTSYDGSYDVMKDIAAQIEPGDLVVADHFWWGTPLRLTFGIDALNGEPVWKDNLAAEAGRFLQESGQRVVFLTSTSKGMSIFPPPLDAAREIYVVPPVTLREAVHTPTPFGFPMRDRVFEFRLHVWEPPP